jgi:hypothetical protein
MKQKEEEELLLIQPIFYFYKNEDPTYQVYLLTPIQLYGY